LCFKLVFAYNFLQIIILWKYLMNDNVSTSTSSPSSLDYDITHDNF
jgi:hypothetical protein